MSQVCWYLAGRDLVWAKGCHTSDKIFTSLKFHCNPPCLLCNHAHPGHKSNRRAPINNGSRIDDSRFLFNDLDYSSKYQQFIKQNEHETYRNRSCFESFISHLWIIAAIILILLGRFLSTLDWATVFACPWGLIAAQRSLMNGYWLCIIDWRRMWLVVGGCLHEGGN